jgi:hypothetical protein
MRNLTSGLRSRLQRLERRRPQPDHDTPRLPSDFWLVLWHLIPFEDAAPETKALIASLCEGSGTREPNPVEERLRLAAARLGLPNGLKKSSEQPMTNGNGRR